MSLGSVRKRGSTWTWYLDGDPDPLTGKRRQLSKGGYRSEQAARQGLKAAVKQQVEGTLTRPSRLTLGGFLTEEWLPAVRPRLRETTFAQYRTLIRAYIVPVLGEVKLQALSPTQLGRFYAHLLAAGRRRQPGGPPGALLAALAAAGQAGARTGELLTATGLRKSRLYNHLKTMMAAGTVERAGHGRWRLTSSVDTRVSTGGADAQARRGLAPKYVRNIHALLHRALKDAVRWGHLARNVAEAVDPPRVPRTEQQVWAPEQLRTFLAHVRDDRLYAMWLLVATTGLRRGELAGLRRVDVDLAAARVSPRRPRVVADHEVVTSEPKTARGRRTLALDPATVAALRAHLERQDAEREFIELPPAEPAELVFTWPDGRGLHPDQITAWFQRHTRAAGLPPIRLHDVRHSYATAALMAGVPAKVISERLGHATVAFTLDVYGHVLPGMDADAATLVASMVLGEPPSPGAVDAAVSTDESGPPPVIGDPFADNAVDNRANGPEQERR